MGFGYPRPEAILSNLKCGDHVRVAGHALYPDGERVFFENAYNVPGVFGNLRDLTVTDVECFLSDMAEGEVWGPVPY